MWYISQQDYRRVNHFVLGINNQTCGIKHQSLGRNRENCGTRIRNGVLINSIKHAYAFCEGKVKPNFGSFCILSFILSSNKVGSLATPMKTHGYVATGKGFHKMLDRPSP